MRVALVQMSISAGAVEGNRRKALSLVLRAGEQKPDVIVLPEMWNTGFCYDTLKDIADRKGEPSITAMAELARSLCVNIVAGSIAEIADNDGRVYNNAYVLDRQGKVVAVYSKVHLFSPMKEDKYFAAGDRAVVFDLDGVRCGIVVCFELRFPELARTLALQGMRVLFVPAQWPDSRFSHWRTLTSARAIENQVFVVACNRVGGKRMSFFGHSVVVNPWGETVLEANDQEGVFVCDIDLEMVDHVRKTIPVFGSRRPDVYMLR
ncbi:MAG: carbon-nitrogen family hydrolase [Bacillota bacterium]